MLKLGEKGAILQRDGQTYAIAPHIPCGVLTPELLRKLADIAEKYDAKALKITGATRIAIVGLKESDIDGVWNDLGMAAGAAVGLCVRSL
jgi:NAD(P)H-nitrite reductase large subunit